MYILCFDTNLYSEPITVHDKRGNHRAVTAYIITLFNMLG